MIKEYNSGILGVDKSNQLIVPYNVWMTLFFHYIGTAVVNSFILFQVHREHIPRKSELSRKSALNQLAFLLQLVNQVLGMRDKCRPSAS